MRGHELAHVSGLQLLRHRVCQEGTFLGEDDSKYTSRYHLLVSFEKFRITRMAELSRGEWSQNARPEVEPRFYPLELCLPGLWL